MAMAGRFMTKWEIVWGMVRIFEEGGGGAAPRVRFERVRIVIVFWDVAFRWRRRSAACWMKVWPSSLKGWTISDTCWERAWMLANGKGTDGVLESDE